MRTLVFFLLLLSACAGEAPPVRSLYPSLAYPSLDAVSRATRRYLPLEFDSHEKHIGWLDSRCVACHHPPASLDNPPKPCAACHAKVERTPEDGPGMMQAMHQCCLGCHLEFERENTASKAPTHCLGCHVQRK